MKGMKTFGVTDYTNLVSLKCCGWTDGRTNKLVVKRLGIMWLEKIWRCVFYVSPTAVHNSEACFKCPHVACDID